LEAGPAAVGKLEWGRRKRAVAQGSKLKGNIAQGSKLKANTGSKLKAERKGKDGEDEKDEGRWTRDEKRTNKIRTVRDLNVYGKAFDSAMEKKADSFCLY